MTIEDSLAESEAAINAYLAKKNRKTAPISPYPHRLNNRIPSGAGMSAFEKQLAQQEGGGIGDIYSNQQLAELNVESEQAEAERVGQQAGIAQERRLALTEEEAIMPPDEIGPDKNGKRLEIFERPYIAPYVLADGTMLYKMQVTYGARFYQSFNDAIRDVDTDSLLNKIYRHAKINGVRLQGMARNLINPTLYDRDVEMTFYGPYRKNLLKGLVVGTRVEIVTNYVSAERLKKIIIALEPESVSSLASKEERGE